MLAVIQVFLAILGLFKLILIITAVMSWLIAFDVINLRNQFVAQVYQFTQQLTEPFLRPIRRIVPMFNGLDLSFLVLWFVIMFIEIFTRQYVVGWVVSAGL